MEFEDTKAISDEERRRAGAKQITLQPINGNVKPEEVFDTIQTTQLHANAQPEFEAAVTKSNCKSSKRNIIEALPCSLFL